MMQHLGMDDREGSEKIITPEDKWLFKFSIWELVDDHAGTSSSASLVASEEYEGSEESDEEEDDE